MMCGIILSRRVLFLALCITGARPEVDRGKFDEALASSAETDLRKILKGAKRGDSARYFEIFSPLRTELAALSPDGKFLAYTVRREDTIFLHVVEVDRPEILKTKVLIHELAPAIMAGKFYEAPPVLWLNWVSPVRLVFATGGLVRHGQSARTGGVTAINADGSDARLLASPRLIHIIDGGRSQPAHIRVLGLHPGRPDSILIVGYARFSSGVSRASFQRFEAYSVNTQSAERTQISSTLLDSRAINLLDRMGRPRVEIAATDTWDFHEPMVHRPPNQPQHAVPLDELAKGGGFAFATENTLGERSVPLGFDVRGQAFYYASNVGRDTFGIYATDLATGERLPGSLESRTHDLLSPSLGTYDAARYFGLERTHDNSADFRLRMWIPSAQLVFDRFTHKLAGVRYEATTRTAVWYRPELQAVQEQLALQRPGRSAEILEWDESLNRFLVREQSPADVGAFFVLDKKQGTYREFVRRGPEPEAGSVAQLQLFNFALPDGSRIDGALALPKESKLKRIPLVLLCPDLPWHRRGASHLREFEALTRMGLAAAIYNGRGAWGTGIKERRKLAVSRDEVQAADLVAVADYLADKFPISRKRVALLGEGHGGYTALRALQLHRDRFSCAVTVETWIRAPGILESVIKGQPLRSRSGFEPVRDTPLSEQPELIKVPVFSIASRANPFQFHANARFHAAVKEAAPDSEFYELPVETKGTPKIRASQWARIESFLNYVLYDYRVDLGDLEVLPDKSAKPEKP